MSSLWNTRKKKWGSLEIIILILVFLVLGVWCNITFKNIKQSTSFEQLDNASDSIRKAVVLCYSTEGVFPPNLQYLKDNYGLSVDESRYIVYYNIYNPHVMPEITLLNRY